MSNPSEKARANLWRWHTAKPRPIPDLTASRCGLTLRCKCTVDTLQQDIVEVSPTIKRAWLKTYLKPKPSERYRYTIEQHDFNCSTSESRIVHLVQYRQNGTVYKESEELTAWSPIIPDTISDELFQIICKGRETYEDILEKDGEESYAKGQRYEEQRDYENALQFYQRAMKDDPGNLTYKLAVSRMQTKRAKPSSDVTNLEPSSMHPSTRKDLAAEAGPRFELLGAFQRWLESA